MIVSSFKPSSLPRTSEKSHYISQIALRIVGFSRGSSQLNIMATLSPTFLQGILKNWYPNAVNEWIYHGIREL